MRKRLTAFFSGSVQGVGFRYTSEHLSRQFQVTGYVKNLSDGRVELVAEGEESELVRFLTTIRESRMGGYIRGLETSWDEPRNCYQSFGITY